MSSFFLKTFFLERNKREGEGGSEGGGKEGVREEGREDERERERFVVQPIYTFIG